MKQPTVCINSGLPSQKTTYFDCPPLQNTAFQLKKNYSTLDHYSWSLIQTQNHFPCICPSVTYHQLFQTPTISNNFSFPLRVLNNGVQLYDKGKSTKFYSHKQPLPSAHRLSLSSCLCMWWQ